MANCIGIIICPLGSVPEFAEFPNAMLLERARPFSFGFKFKEQRSPARNQYESICPTCAGLHSQLETMSDT